MPEKYVVSKELEDYWIHIAKDGTIDPLGEIAIHQIHVDQDGNESFLPGWWEYLRTGDPSHLRPREFSERNHIQRGIDGWNRDDEA